MRIHNRFTLFAARMGSIGRDVKNKNSSFVAYQLGEACSNRINSLLADLERAKFSRPASNANQINTKCRYTSNDSL